MKVIISHDVDHLYGRDHWMRDLIYPKLIIRSLISYATKRITYNECRLRIKSCFQKERNKILQVMEFDRSYSVKSTFFFGMNQGLGMSYYPEEAKSKIITVINGGFDVGVHGICYDDEAGIRDEYNTFVDTVGFQPHGIRMHYVRFNDTTFRYEAKVGYLFDSTEFDKKNRKTVKAPYCVDGMWEFPLGIMDVYLTQEFEKAKEETLSVLKEYEKKGINYITILLHDNVFDDSYQELKKWYIWFIQYIHSSERYSFTSFEEAIAELECNKYGK